MRQPEFKPVLVKNGETPKDEFEAPNTKQTSFVSDGYGINVDSERLTPTNKSLNNNLNNNESDSDVLGFVMAQSSVPQSRDSGQ